MTQYVPQKVVKEAESGGGMQAEREDGDGME